MNSGGEEGKQRQGIEVERRKAKQSKKKKKREIQKSQRKHEWYE